jgi:hypothetical protein
VFDALEPIGTGGVTSLSAARSVIPMQVRLRARNCQEANPMAFILGVIFFVIVVGMIDSRIPWSRVRQGADLK